MRPALRSWSLQSPAFIVLTALAMGGASVSAATMYWGGASSVSANEGAVAKAGNWFTDPTGATVALAAPNSLDDDLVFNATPANTVGGVVRIDANFAANSFTFNTSGPTVLAQDANRSVALGGGGITLNAASGPVSFGVKVNTLNVRLAASQNWINHSASALTVRNVTTQAGAGPVILSLSAAGSGHIILPLSVADTLDDPLSIVVDSAGSGSITIGTSAYSGDTTINRGKLSMTGATGAGEILLGDTSGAADATLALSFASFSSNITVRSGSSGSKTLVCNNPLGVLNGTMVLDDKLTLVAVGRVTTLNGAVSGVGSLVKDGNGGLTLAGSNTFSGSLTINAGALTLAETGSLTFSIGASGVNSQINGASSSTVTIHGTFDFKISDAALVDGSSWSIVAASRKTFGPAFGITGFSRTEGVWTNGAGLTFSESTGTLTYKRNP